MTTARPAHIEAERAVLGAAIKRSEILDRSDLTPDHFYLADHATLWRLLLQLRKSGVAIDQITLPVEVAQRGAAAYGGVAYVLGHADVCGATANWDHYERIVQQDSARRKLLDLAEVMSEGAHGDRDPLHVIEHARRGLDGLGVSAGGSWRCTAETMPETIATIERRASGEEAEAISTGIAALDAALSGGVRAGQLVVMAGRPSMGKTALALEVLYGVADAGEAVGIVEMEMSDQEVDERLISQRSHVPLRRVSSGDCDSDQWRAIMGAVEDLGMLRMEKDCRGGHTPESLAAAAFRLDRRVRSAGFPGLSLLVVDYLQLVRVQVKSGENRASVIGDLSASLKSLAMELQCCVLALSQLNRQCEQRTDKRPLMSDLRESGAIEQDADVVLMLYRDEVYDEDTRDAGVLEVLIRKQRNGPLGVVPLYWEGTTTSTSEPDAHWVREWLRQRGRG